MSRAYQLLPVNLLIENPSIGNCNANLFNSDLEQNIYNLFHNISGRIWSLSNCVKIHQIDFAICFIANFTVRLILHVSYFGNKLFWLEGPHFINHISCLFDIHTLHEICRNSEPKRVWITDITKLMQCDTQNEGGNALKDLKETKYIFI